MGVDLYIRVKQLPEKEWVSFDTHGEKTIYLDRVFGRVYQNSIRGDEAILFQLQDKLNIDVDFLFKPNYYDYSTEEDEWLLEYMEDANTKDRFLETIRKGKIDAEKSWIDIKWFLTELRTFKNNLQLIKDYHIHLKGWGSYFENQTFENDIEKMNEILTELNQSGIKEFTFDIM